MKNKITMVADEDCATIKWDGIYTGNKNTFEFERHSCTGSTIVEFIEFLKDDIGLDFDFELIQEYDE